MKVFAMSGGKGNTTLTAIPRQDYIEHLFSATDKVVNEITNDNEQLNVKIVHSCSSSSDEVIY